MVSMRLYPAQIDIVAHDAVVASHPRSFTRQQTLYDWQHYIPLIERKPGALRNGAPFADMPAPLQQLRGLLLRREGGDRVMAKVLVGDCPSPDWRRCWSPSNWCWNRACPAPSTSRTCSTA